jgi:hypothetical protein
MPRARILAVAIAVLGLAAPAKAGSDPVERARSILRSGGYQTDLPRGAGRGPGAEAGRATPEPESPPPVRLPVPPRALVLTVFAVGIVVVLLLLLRGVDMRRPLREAAPAGDPTATPPPRAVAAGEDHEALARDGRFAEAIHALLLGALRDVGRRAGSSPAWTSREVLHGAGLRHEARTALAPLVGVVEAVHFGRTAAGLEDYMECAALYRRFQEACRATR